MKIGKNEGKVTKNLHIFPVYVTENLYFRVLRKPVPSLITKKNHSSWKKVQEKNSGRNYKPF